VVSEPTLPPYSRTAIATWHLDCLSEDLVPLLVRIMIKFPIGTRTLDIDAVLRRQPTSRRESVTRSNGSLLSAGPEIKLLHDEEVIKTYA
jgi:hypothetical protein